MRATTFCLSCILGALAINSATAADVKVTFFDNSDQDGDAASYPVTVTTECTKCEGFGFRLTNSWESYSLSGATASYTLHIYDDGNCGKSTKTAELKGTSGNFPGTLKDSVDSWILCPPGASP